MLPKASAPISPDLTYAAFSILPGLRFFAEVQKC